MRNASDFLNVAVEETHKFKVQEWLEKDEKVVASLAPSYFAEFDWEPGKMAGVLKDLGLFGVEETVTVLPEIVEARNRFIENREKPIIFSSCPIIRKVVEDEFPHLKKFLCGLPSPMVLHGKRLKERFPESKLIFIGPCPAKKREEDWFYEEHVYDAVLTFKELRDLLKNNNVDTKNSSPWSFLSTPQPWARFGLLVYYESGLKKVIRFLKQWDNEQLKEPVVELLACEGGCLMGPGMTTRKTFKERLDVFRKFYEKEG